MPGSKRLRHGSEVAPKTRRLCARDSQCIGDALGIQLQQFCACCSAAERSQRARGMKTGAVMARRNGFGNLAFDFHTDMVSKREVFACIAIRFGEREHGRKNRHGRMSE